LVTVGYITNNVKVNCIRVISKENSIPIINACTGVVFTSIEKFIIYKIVIIDIMEKTPEFV